ncbi:hypothetical protein F0U61_05315 [Archangium violaceum]|uniref:hypothetical protein n=1 Tax=Archangium violaceum TaxID=83451 RepID=UPI002B295FFE|nr:hypothetical protein F0U61_05315 [Archangium violaceum]
MDDLEGADARERGSPPAPIGSWNPKWEAELPSRKAWRELLQDAATGLDGNLEQRKRELDAESYAVELGHAERARLSVQDRWREFVTRVAEDAHQRLHRIQPGVRFLLPIDDADMNPHRCVELLDLVRTFWHPRIVFLLTGDTDLFIKTLHLHHQGQFDGLLGRASGASRASLRSLNTKPEAHELAWTTYDKVIPRSQRLHLPPLPPPHRLLLMKDLLDVEVNRLEPTLPPAKLTGYFEINPSLLQGFPDHLRQLQDLRQRLGSIDSQGRAGPLVHQMWQSALMSGNVSPTVRGALEQVVQLREQGLHVDVRDELTWKTNLVGQYAFKTSNTALYLGVGTGFEYSLPDQTQPIPENLLALLVLALDLARDEKDGSLGTRPIPYGWTNPLVGGIITLEDARSVPFPWPLPDWEAPNDYHSMMRAWVHPELQKSSSLSGKTLSTLARRFLDLVYDIEHQRAPGAPLASGGSDPLKQTLGRLVESIDTLVKKQQSGPLSPRQEEFETWLWERALLLAAPESGLTADLANELLATWFSLLDRKRLARMKKRLKQGRRMRAETALEDIELRPGETVESILEQIDLHYSDFDWAHDIEGRTPPVVGMSPQLQSALQRIPVQHPRGSSAQEPETLAGYIEALGIKPYVSARSKRRMDDFAETMGLLASSQASASAAIRELWTFVLTQTSKADRKKTQGWFGSVNGKPVLTLPAELRQRLTEPATLRIGVQEEFPLEGSDSKLRFHESGEFSAGALAAAYGVLQLAHDVDADELDASKKDPAHQEGTPPLTFRTPEENWAVAFPHASTVVHFQGKEVQLDWPVPAWNTFLDWRLMDQLWKAASHGISGILTQTQDITPHKYGLALLIRTLLEGMKGFTKHRGSATSSANFSLSRERNTAWSMAASWIFDVNIHEDLKGSRWMAVRRWANSAALLFATPEMGMPIKDVDAFLKLWRPTLPWGIKTDATRQMRRIWACRSLRLAGLEHDDATVGRFLKEIDDKNPEHPWHERFGPNTPNSSGPDSDPDPDPDPASDSE